MKALSRFITGSLVVCLLLLPHSTNSCGIYILSGDMARVCLFQPDIKAPRNMYPFFFSAHYYYTNNLYNESYPEFQNKDLDMDNSLFAGYYTPIINDWHQHLRYKASLKDISYVLFDSDISYFYQAYDSLLEHNGFLRLLQQPAYQEEFKYLLFAKELELLSGEGDPWECTDCPDVKKNGMINWKQLYVYYNEPVNTLTGNSLKTLSGKAYQAIASTRNDFLRTRYAFLLARMLFYNNHHEELCNVYDKYLKHLPDNNYLKCYTQLYVAQTKPEGEACYLMSKVFEYCPEKRYRAQELFNPKGIAQALTLAQNNHEKAVLLMMSITQNPGNCVSTLSDILQLDPTCSLLPFVVTREINKLEDINFGKKYTESGPVVSFNLDQYYMSNDYTGEQADEIRYLLRVREASDRKHNREMISFLERAIRKGTDPDFYRLCSGYMAYMNGKNEEAAKHYNGILITPQTSALVNTQLELNKLVLEISTSKVITPAIEQRIMNYLSLLKENKHEYLYYEYMRSQFLFFTGKLFIEKGEIAKGIMLLGHTRQVYAFQAPYFEKNAYHMMLDIARPEDFRQIITIIDHPETSFEKLLASPGIQYAKYYHEFNSDDYVELPADTLLPWNKNRIYDIQSMYHIRHNEIGKAYAITCLIEDRYWTEYPYKLFTADDPFWIEPYDPVAPFNPKKKRYNKRTILKKVLELFHTAKQSPERNERALAYFQLAGFYLSSTHYGKYWILSNNFKNTYSSYDEQFVSSHPEFFKPELAKSYYLKAAREAVAPDLAAMSTFMAWVCGNKIKISRENPYLATIKNNRSAMDYYDHYTSCMLIPEFFKKYHR